MFPGLDPFLEHFTGFPASHAPPAWPDTPVLDPLLLGVLTAAVEDESADAYRHGFQDGLRAAALMPGDDDLALAESDDLADVPVGEGDWHR